MGVCLLVRGEGLEVYRQLPIDIAEVQLPESVYLVKQRTEL